MTSGGTSQKKGFLARLGAIPAGVWVALVLTVLMAVFILQNRGDAVIYLLNVSVTAPLWATLVITWLVGLLAGLLVAWRRRR